MAGEKKLITAQALAEALDLSVETIWRYTREKKIPYVELGSKQYRYNLEEVLQAIGTTVREEAAKYESDAPKKFTYQDYLELPEEPGYRFEVLKGMLIKEPSPNVMHQRVSRRLQRVLEDYFWEMDPQAEVFNAPLDVTFGDITVVQPDLFYISGEQKEIVKDTRIDGAYLVVEVITSSSGGRVGCKNAVYRKLVQRHWLVGPEEKTPSVSACGMVYAWCSGMDEDGEHPVTRKTLIS